MEGPEFAEIWRSSTSVAEVAEKTGYSHHYCTVLASRLRLREGLSLPPFKRGRKLRVGGGYVHANSHAAPKPPLPTAQRVRDAYLALQQAKADYAQARADHAVELAKERA